MQAGGLNGGAFLRLSQGLHLGIATSDFQAGDHTAFLDQVIDNAADGNKTSFEALKDLEPLRRYDALLAYEFSSALAAGLRVERIVAIAEGGAQGAAPPPVAFAADARAMRRGESKTEVSAGEAEVTATVTVRFLLR